jgi:superoxide reductase
MLREGEFMSADRAFYRCSVCGNLVGLVNQGDGELTCHGKPMTLLVANTTEGAREKHIPVGTREGGTLHVAVGSIPHPMLETHYIQWICVAQGNRTQRVALSPGQAPEADFAISDGPAAIYEYCNLHGLWRSEIPG